MDDQNKKIAQEAAFHKALKSYGYVFPETEEELQAFENSISKMKFEIPEKLDNPSAFLKKGKIKGVGNFNSFYDEEVEENLAQAAREGSDIPNDVWQQMEKDRKNAEEANDDERAD